MAELRRLGRRGSYRLGRLGTPPSGPERPPAPHYPSFAPPRRGPVTIWLAGCLAGVLIIAGAAELGLWFLPFLAGIAGGAAARYGRLRLLFALPVAAVTGAIGWAVPLLWEIASGVPVQAVAREVAALAGLPAHASLIIIVTLLVAAIQAACGLCLAYVFIPRPQPR
jgi:hypothetical protein